jgi:hypothetical protein
MNSFGVEGRRMSRDVRFDGMHFVQKVLMREQLVVWSRAGREPWIRHGCGV